MNREEAIKIMGSTIYVRCKNCNTDFTKPLDRDERIIKCPVCGERIE